MPFRPTPLGPFRIGEHYYNLLLDPLTDIVSLVDQHEEVWISFLPDSCVLEGKDGRMLGRFSLQKNRWCFHPFNSDDVYTYEVDLVACELEISKRYINGEL